MKFYTHNSSPLDRSLSPVISFWDAAWRTVNHTYTRHSDSTNSNFMCYLMSFIPTPTEVSANELCAECADSSTRKTDRQANCSCHACYVAVLQTPEEYHENTAAKISRQKWKLVQNMSHRASPETRPPCTVTPRCTQSTLSQKRTTQMAILELKTLFTCWKEKTVDTGPSSASTYSNRPVI